MWPFGFFLLAVGMLLRAIFDICFIVFMILPRPIQIVVVAWLGFMALWVLFGLLYRLITA